MTDTAHTTVSEIGASLEILLTGVTGIEKVFSHPPVESELATTKLPCVSYGYSGVRTDNYEIKHMWLVALFFDARKDRAETTEQQLKTVTQAVFDAFTANKSLTGTVINAYPTDGRVEVLSSQRAAKLLNIVLLLNVQTTLVRR